MRLVSVSVVAFISFLIFFFTVAHFKPHPTLPSLVFSVSPGGADNQVTKKMEALSPQCLCIPAMINSLAAIKQSSATLEVLSNNPLILLHQLH